MQWQNRTKHRVAPKSRFCSLVLLLLLPFPLAAFLPTAAAMLTAEFSTQPMQGSTQQVSPQSTTQVAQMPPLLWQAAWQDLQTLSSDEMAGRSSGSAGSVLAQQYIQQRFYEIGLQALTTDYRQPFAFKVGFSQHRGVNLFAMQKGCSYPDIYIVVTAHYDHLKSRGKTIYNGADDNASGVAGLLYLAALLKQQCPAYSYLFVATDAEEHGLDGARAFLANPPVPAAQMLLNINLDMIGRGERRNRLYLLGKRSLPAIKTMPRTEQAGVRLVLANEQRDQSRGSASVDWSNASDHGVFRRAGIPYLYFGVDLHADYHTQDDDWQRIDPDFFQAALVQISSTVYWLEQQNPTQLQYPREAAAD